MSVSGKFRIPTTIEESKELASTISADLGKVKGSPQRLGIMLGMRTKGIFYQAKETIPSEDRSCFSMEKYSFLLESEFSISDKCCSIMKKNPSKLYEKETGRIPIIATMASESRLRTQKWLESGCNAFDSKRPSSKPMSFWTEQDVLLYIKTHNLPICSVYGDVVFDYDKEGQIEGQMDLSEMTQFGIFDTGRRPLKTTGCHRTGCVLCGFGAHCKGDTRFVDLKETNPKFYNLLDVVKNNGVTYREAIEWVNEHGNLDIKL